MRGLKCTHDMFKISITWNWGHNSSIYNSGKKIIQWQKLSFHKVSFTSVREGLQWIRKRKKFLRLNLHLATTVYNPFLLTRHSFPWVLFLCDLVEQINLYLWGKGVGNRKSQINSWLYNFRSNLYVICYKIKGKILDWIKISN